MDNWQVLLSFSLILVLTRDSTTGARNDYFEYGLYLLHFLVFKCLEHFSTELCIYIAGVCAAKFLFPISYACTWYSVLLSRGLFPVWQSINTIAPTIVVINEFSLTYFAIAIMITTRILKHSFLIILWQCFSLYLSEHVLLQVFSARGLQLEKISKVANVQFIEVYSLFLSQLHFGCSFWLLCTQKEVVGSLSLSKF